MRTCRECRALIVIAALLLISPVGLYVGAYYALVRAAAMNGSSMRAHVSPGYPHCTLIDCDWLFAPMHAIDRRLRPNYWVRRIDAAVFLSSADDWEDPTPSLAPMANEVAAAQ